MATRISIDGYRHYYDAEGNPYPSVTTVLSRTASEKNKKALQSWAEKNPGGMEAAASRGTAVHACVEAWIRGVDPDPGPYADYWDGLDRYLEPYSEFLWSERPLVPEWSHTVGDDGIARVWHPSGYAGCPDIVAKRDGLVGLLDLKTSVRPYRRWFPSDKKDRQAFSGYMKFRKCSMQLAAYSRAIEHTCNQRIDFVGILVATPEMKQCFILDDLERQKYELAWARKLEEYQKLVEVEKRLAS
ncbi:hypothetical protein [Synechococcus elongatus]|uniref:hypothetical protein n=1 Tax=Synechococcus elongatus TaxID=32046 RepID=UPI000F7E2074|nr:hypothetical protein [Synechococcus elongatus]